ncbi:DUF1481 domain-containing protein [Vibrio sp. SA48]|uniref:DUF1481 domain-containing protein n=1 Tax=Vibrio aestuarianus TaxID=28171 RepID=A0A9X4J4D1_9VIBR|nr:DUF1481 domain-containing protein [Vibrio aestuarianus]KOE84859.1 peptidylprolyl isomerase [Vibrio alginolyticus]MDE1210729.1 DUF1481 domain-containing protein [Vibrio aestuarianus]MDE1220621.1 DUF1481 domain-containing protein [Vibrio aestuarianus]MDE1223783.1 DUF1481 domain-containing protein [Vibrio aestuarianus]MDE1230916.1 DUF1481 domain-containing protein [Vibrio aestuarianus]
MKKFLLPSLCSLFLIGCTASSHTPNIEQYVNYTSGQTMGDATSFYWYTERLVLPNSAADYVNSGEYGGYQTNYRWDEGSLRELKREGSLPSNNNLVPYSIHLRFNKDGEAVYQQYRVDGKVLPLSKEQLSIYLAQSQYVASVTKDNRGLSLIQGVWDGEVFASCTGNQYSQVEFNQNLHRVDTSSSSPKHYLAFLGKVRNNRMYVEKLLMQADENHGCVNKPQLIED